MATLLLVRHGETDWNVENRFQGHADPPLNETGREQSRELAQQLAGERLAAIVSSPLRRALETAETIAGVHDLPLRQEPGLREVDLGSWTGLTRTEVEARDPGGYRRWLEYGYGWADGESYEELAERVVATLLELAMAFDGATVATVTHGGPIRAALAAAAGISYGDVRRNAPPIGNCAVFRIVVDDDGRFMRAD